MMPDREKVIKEKLDEMVELTRGLSYAGFMTAVENANDILALLKEQDAMNVDAFVEWCIDSHIMGDATVSGIKYWVGKYKEIKEGR